MGTQYKLKHPIKRLAGEELTSVPVRRLKGKDMRAASKEADEGDVPFFLLGRATGLDPAEVDELDAQDLEALLEKLNVGKAQASQDSSSNGGTTKGQ